MARGPLILGVGDVYYSSKKMTRMKSSNMEEIMKYLGMLARKKLIDRSSKINTKNLAKISEILLM